MARIVILDAGPLWLCVQPRGNPQANDCRDWLVRLNGAGVTIAIPETADYEVRRELLFRRATAALRRLDNFKATVDYRPIRTRTMLKAAELWAAVRHVGLPTAGAQSLDADAILAAIAVTGWGPSDNVTVGTNNVRHLGNFPGVVARLWTMIV